MVQASFPYHVDFHCVGLGRRGRSCPAGTPDIATTYIKPLGTIFLNLIKMIVVPLVIFSMIAGVISLSDIKKVGAIGGKTIAYYLCTTACAIVIGLIIANVFNVGGGYTLTADELSYEAKPRLPSSRPSSTSFPATSCSPCPTPACCRSS